MGPGFKPLCTELRYRNGEGLFGDFLNIDYAKAAQGYGYDTELCRWVESVHAGRLTGPSSWNGYVACVAGDALNASRNTSRFLKVETMEKTELYK